MRKTVTLIRQLEFHCCCLSLSLKFVNVWQYEVMGNLQLMHGADFWAVSEGEAVQADDLAGEGGGRGGDHVRQSVHRPEEDCPLLLRTAGQ